MLNGRCQSEAITDTCQNGSMHQIRRRCRIDNAPPVAIGARLAPIPIRNSLMECHPLAVDAVAVAFATTALEPNLDRNIKKNGEIRPCVSDRKVLQALQLVDGKSSPTALIGER